MKDKHTDIRTLRLIERIGPESQFFKNPASKTNFTKKNPFFCSAILHPLWAKVSNLRPLLLITFHQRFQKSKKLDIGLWEARAKRRLNGMNKKKSVKFVFTPRQFYTHYEKKFSNLRHFLSITFPKGFRKSKKFWHWTLGNEGKKDYQIKWESLTDNQTSSEKNLLP